MSVGTKSATVVIPVIAMTVSVIGSARTDGIVEAMRAMTIKKAMIDFFMVNSS